MISSTTNPKIKHVRRLLSERRFRQREKQFVAEGTRWLEDVLATEQRPIYWLATTDWITKHESLVAAFTERGLPPIEIETAVAQNISDTETPSGVFTVLAQPELDWPQAPAFLLVLDGLQDPGNMGTLLRTATAAGVEGVLLMPGSVDPFNPKVTRSTMGTLLRLPWRQAKWEDLNGYIGTCQLYLAAGEGTKGYTAVDWCQPSALIVGNEAHGASQSARDAANHLISIPMQRQTESLNAAVAGSIILFEAVRQRLLPQ